MPIFATSTSTAIIARHYSDEVMVWARGDDLNQTLSDDAKLALGLFIANAIPRPACVVQMTNGSSDRTQNAMTSNYPLIAIYDRFKRISRITVYEYQ